MNQAFFDWNEMEWEVIDEHSARKVVTLDHVMCVMFRLRKGLDAPPHSHPHEQLATVIEGRVIVQIGDEEKQIGPLEGYRVPPNVPHKVTILEDVIVIDSFSPIREEFLGR